jgi:NADH-quinone oxidoreductase subunit J
MNAASFIFYALAALALGSALLAISSPRIFRAAIFLLFSLLGVAGLYLWMEYAFVFAVQVIVYVGGIVVLIIFSIFLTQQAGARLPAVRPGRRVFAGLACLAGFLLSWLLVRDYEFPETYGAPVPGVDAIGRQLLDTQDTGMALPFELVSILPSPP